MCVVYIWATWRILVPSQNGLQFRCVLVPSSDLGPLFSDLGPKGAPRETLEPQMVPKWCPMDLKMEVLSAGSVIQLRCPLSRHRA